MITIVLIVSAGIALSYPAVSASPMITGTNVFTVRGYNSDCVDSHAITPITVNNKIKSLSQSSDCIATRNKAPYDVPIGINTSDHPVGSLNITATGNEHADDKKKVRVIVMFREKPDTELIRAYSGEIKRSYKIIPAVAAVLPERAEVYALERDNPSIAYIEPDYEVQTMDTLPWGVDRINAELVWNGADGKSDVTEGRNTGSGIDISIIDTGIDYNHLDLADNYKGGYDFVNDDADPMDDCGHGTHCAGVIAAEANGDGIVGTAPEAHLYAVKALDNKGQGYMSNVIAGIEWSVKNNMNIVSMSIGSTQDSTALREACDKAYDAGLLLVASSGNNGNADGTDDTVTYPGRYASVIAIAATDSGNKRASFSGTGPAVEFAAPGVGIYSTYLDNAYTTKSGTSMACPHVTGTAALIWSAYPNFTNAQVRAQLQETAEDLGVAGKDDEFGYGLVNAKKAAYVSTPDNAPPASIDNLKVSSRSETGIMWGWSNPPDMDFHYTMVFLNGIWVTNTSNTYYYAKGLRQNTSYEIGTHTVDEAGNVNAAWVNHTAKTEDEAVLSQSSTSSYSPSLYYGGRAFYIKPKTTPVSNNLSYRRISPVQGKQVSRYYTKAIFNRTACNSISSFGVYSQDTGKERRTAIYTGYKYPRVCLKSTNVTASNLHSRQMPPIQSGLVKKAGIQ